MLRATPRRIAWVAVEASHLTTGRVVHVNIEQAVARPRHRRVIQRQFQVLTLRRRERQIDVLARRVGAVRTRRTGRRNRAGGTGHHTNRRRRRQSIVGRHDHRVRAAHRQVGQVHELTAGRIERGIRRRARRDRARIRAIHQERHAVAAWRGRHTRDVQRDRVAHVGVEGQPFDLAGAQAHGRTAARRNRRTRYIRRDQRIETDRAAIDGRRQYRVRARRQIPQMLRATPRRIAWVAVEASHLTTGRVVHINIEQAIARPQYRGVVQRQLQVLALRDREHLTLALVGGRCCHGQRRGCRQGRIRFDPYRQLRSRGIGRKESNIGAASR